MKKLFILIALLLGVTLTSCDSADNLNKNEVGKDTVKTTEALQQEMVSEYVMSGLGGVSLLNAGIKSNAKLSLTDSQKDEVITNFEALEGLLSSEVSSIVEETSDRQEYSVKQVIELTLVDGSKDTYTFYYNEVELPRDLDDDLDEFEYRLDGIVLADDLTYTLIGEKEIETGEVEQEFKITSPDGSYVVVEKEVEQDEESFNYEKYENGRKVMEIELEYELDENKVEYEIKQRSGQSTYKYEIMSRGEDNLVKVYIRNGRDVITTTFTVSKDLDGNRIYTFK